MAYDDRVLKMTPADVVRHFENTPDLQSMAADVRKSLLPDVEDPEDTDYPPRWSELSDEQKGKVNKYIDTLLAKQPALPLIEKAGREVVKRRVMGSVSYQLEMVKCGKDCKGCPHGPYWYGYYRNQKGKVVSTYIGKDFKRLM
jgi:hypothetical protein